MNKLTNTHRFHVNHQQFVSCIHRQKGGIVLLIWEYRDTHYMQERTNPNPYVTHAVRFRGVAPKPQRGCQFLHSKRKSFSPEFKNPKALIPVCYNRCEKVWTNWQTGTNLSWFSNSLLATSTGRREESFYWYGNIEIRIIDIGKI